MTAPIEVIVQNLSTGVEVVRTYDSKNEALMKTNSLIVQMMRKYNVEELFIRYRAVKEKKVVDLIEDLPF